MEQKATDHQEVLVASIKRAKTPYSSPVLRVYGSVHKFTQGSMQQNSDGTGGMTQNSDRSIKENIVRIGTHPLGIGLYLFDYKVGYREETDVGRHFGVMADEVETVMPLAVLMHQRGHKMVNYSMLGISVSDRNLH